MQCTTGWGHRQRQWLGLVHLVAVLAVILVAARGERRDSWAGAVCRGSLPSGVWSVWRGRKGQRQAPRWDVAWAWMRGSWVVVAIRSEVLLGWAVLAGHREWTWLCLLPWVEWLWKGMGVAWPSLRRQPLYSGLSRLLEVTYRLAFVGLGAFALVHGVRFVQRAGTYLPSLALGSVGSASRVEVKQDEEGIYHVHLQGEFALSLDGKVAFYKRILILFLGHLVVPGETRGSRRTRDERTPFVRQQQLAAWFDVRQPVISRWMGYWLHQDWQRLLSQQAREVLTLELQQQIIDTWVQFPWWGVQRLWSYLRDQGMEMTRSQVQQAARESGWSVLRRRLHRVYAIDADAFRPRDEWLVGQLLALVQTLVGQLEERNALTPEQRMAWCEVQTLAQEVGTRPAVAHAPLPWLLQLERFLLGRWDPVRDETVRCIYCGSTDVSRKSRKGRLKRYVDEAGQEQTVAVYRYYCHHPACRHKSFTHLPPNLIPYSKWTLQHHLAAWQLYEGSRSVYRRTSQWLGVSKMTAYRWVSAFGGQLLPVAALFGVVRSSGVVGIDEKYVRVPHNDKHPAKMKGWMYVYVAVDSYTYDLLHIEIYPYNDKQSATAFLWSLRAKGYHPRVVVTDLRVDYGPLVAQVFPKATHHECIFHALRQAHRHLRDAYRAAENTAHPDIDALREAVDALWDTPAKRTAQRRYEKLMAQREKLVACTPQLGALFDFLERHWLTLVNAVESEIIPTTNNTAEQVIRIFAQHYKTFCGFQHIASARCYLSVFEKTYRFTPFSADAQPHIRGRCPLELAGYDIRTLPMAQLFRAFTLRWPDAALQELVPNV
jgi:transposase-like protein